MIRQILRSPTAALAAVPAMVAATAVVTLSTPTTGPDGPVTVTADVALADDTALIMGGTGMPDPPQWFLDKVQDFYLDQHFPSYTPVALHTPEESWPITGWLTGGQSVTLGMENLHRAITDTYEGDNFVVFGVSQSAMIAGVEMQNLVDNPPDDLGDLHFVLLGGPTNPMGGIFGRLTELDVPGMGLLNSGPTPTDLFPTAIYSGEYDGVSDFPRDLSNIVSVLNAIAGMNEVHMTYGDLTAEQVESAVHLGHTGMTDFYMIPTQILPLLQPLYDSSDVGKAIVDLIQPTVKVMVDLGYGNLNHGEVPDPGGLDGYGAFGFLPRMDPLAVMAAFQLGQVEGTVNFTNDILAYNGLPDLPDWVTDVLKATSGYTLTSWADQMMISGLTQLSTLPGMEDLHPDVVFDGLPMIDGTEFMTSVNQWVDDTLGDLFPWLSWFGLD